MIRKTFWNDGDKRPWHKVLGAIGKILLGSSWDMRFYKFITEGYVNNNNLSVSIEYTCAVSSQSYSKFVFFIWIWEQLLPKSWLKKKEKKRKKRNREIFWSAWTYRDPYNAMK